MQTNLAKEMPAESHAGQPRTTRPCRETMQHSAKQLMKLKDFAEENGFDHIAEITDAVVGELSKVMQIMRQHGINVGQAGNEKGNGFELTTRELECMKWCAHGKTYWETAIILGISERTVDSHMKSARYKLDATTNAHCVVKATRYHLI